MNYHTISVQQEGKIFSIRFVRPQAGNSINDQFIEECRHILNICGAEASVVVLKGSAEVFCMGADFNGMNRLMKENAPFHDHAAALYDIWLQLSGGPFITIAHVKGKANAGGVGFVAAADIVIADTNAKFSLSELLFGLFPACVLPFLVRRIGFQKAHYLTLMTKPITAEEAVAYGLADVSGGNSDQLLQQHLSRLRLLQKDAVHRYKNYMNDLHPQLKSWQPTAIAASRNMFSNKECLALITRYVETGFLPWEGKSTPHK